MRKLLINPGHHDLPTSLGLLLLRVVPAIFLLVDHGAAKVKAFGVGVADPFGLGRTASASLLVMVEVAAPILLILGLFTRPAALLGAAGLGLMVLRFPGWDAGFFAGSTGSYLYLAAFAGMVLTGAGAFSVDRLIQGKPG